MANNQKLNPISHALRSFLKKCGLDIPAGTSLGWLGIAILTFAFIVYLANLGYKLIDRTNDKVADHVVKKADSELHPQVAGATDQPKEEVIACKDIVCEDFSDLSHWPKSVNFKIVSTNPLRITAPASVNFAGWIMDYYKPVPLNSEIVFSFIPHGEKANTVIRFSDLYNLIIGDDGYYRVSLKGKNGYVTPKGNKAQHFTLAPPIAKDNLVKVKVEHRILKGTNKVEVYPTVTYFDLNGIEHTVSVPEFTVSADSDPSSIIGSVGVGLLDSQKSGKIEATFEQFLVRESF